MKLYVKSKPKNKTLDNYLRFKNKKLGYKDSNLEMLESESSALPFGDSPSYVSKRLIYNVSCKYFTQALSYYIIIFSKKQALFYKNFSKKQITFSF